MSQDPIGFEGGLNLYAYVGNNPVGFVDPEGLDLAVVWSGKVAGNPLGHSAIAVSGEGTFSIVTGGPPGMNLTSYVSNQLAERDVMVQIIHTTPEQDAAVMDYLKSCDWGRDIPRYLSGHTCAKRTSSALMKAGFGKPNTAPLAIIGDALPQRTASIAKQAQEQQGGTTMTWSSGNAPTKSQINQLQMFNQNPFYGPVKTW